MGNTRFEIARGAQEEKVDTPERIAGWLKELHMNGNDEDVSEVDDNPRKQKEKAETATPPRKGSTHEAHDELSPTDTSFSGPSIFDSPLRKYHFPGRPGTIDNDIFDDLSDITSISSDNRETIRKEEHSLESVDQLASPYDAAYTSVQPASITSHDPPSDIDEIFEDGCNPNISLDIESRDPNQPRMVWIASCLQCTLAGLSCSRTPPACSRCKRKGNADVCLLQRRWFPEEIAQPSGSTYALPILLKLKGEDEGVWERKRDLANELYEKWLAELDRKNWVLPGVESPRGGYPVIGRSVRVLHPGEGSGQVVHAEMIVDMAA